MFIGDLQKKYEKYFDIKRNNDIINKFENIKIKWHSIHYNMTKVENTLDKAIYGHKIAKRQIERIIGQWMNGEQTGYCFGFEGPPGVGKTSLAKKATL